jgi:ABC-type nitrate/sulfonate/bicarbonate transport system ATPase subunit
MSVLIDVQNVTRIYRDSSGNPVYALKQVDLAVEKGEFVSIIGPSGCGKTTLLRLIAGLDRPEEGNLAINGTEIRGPGYERGYIFQQAALFPWATVHDNVALGLKARKIYAANGAPREKVREYIRMIGLDGFENAYPHELSGGMAQRVAIIRSLINEPEVLLLDEPFGALDAFKRIELQEQLARIWKQTGATMVMVTHDVDEAIALSNRIVIMTPRPGHIVRIVDVPLTAARDRNSDDFLTLRKHILEELHLVISKPQPEYTI